MKFIRLFNDKLGERLCVVDGRNIYDFSDAIGTDIVRLIREGKLNDPMFLKGLRANFKKMPRLPFPYEKIEESKKGAYRILMPYMPPEVWAVGVTYKKTMALHEEDIKSKGNLEGLYRYVYDSKRPEIFFKALPQHCVGTHEPFSIRSDSSGTIVEAELACIYDSDGAIIAYTAANDITAWDIEKECPLFLNQAKMFKGSCVIGPAVVPAVEIENPLDLDVHCRIERRHKTIVNARGSTRLMKRTLKEMTKYLMLNNTLSDGAILCTGTAVGIPNDVVIKNGDIVTVYVEHIGALHNIAVKLRNKRRGT